jgi:hypothetical protein
MSYDLVYTQNVSFARSDTSNGAGPGRKSVSARID